MQLTAVSAVMYPHTFQPDSKQNGTMQEFMQKNDEKIIAKKGTGAPDYSSL